MLMKYNESNAALRRVRFDIRGLDGLTAATGENGAQPEISVNDAGWTSTGISVLTAIGNGRYYATLTQAVVATPGTNVQTRFKSSNTIETAGDTVQVVGFDPNGYGGTGARKITLTVNDGATPIESVNVRLTKGADTVSSVTNVSGQAILFVDDGTWTVALTRNGYTYAGTTLVVTADATPTYSMTPITISASPAGQVTGFFTTYDENGVAESGVTIRITVAEVANDDSGQAYSEDERIVVSDQDGLVEITRLFKGVTYYLIRGSSRKRYHVTIPIDASSPYELPSIIGSP